MVSENTDALLTFRFPAHRVLQMQRAYSYRADPSVPPFADDRPILIFDGMCVLCSGVARFVLRFDRHHRLRLLAAQTPLGAALYTHFELAPGDYESNILLEDGEVRTKSDGSIRIFEIIGFPWSFLTIGRILPRAWRDWIYVRIARNRLNWFGRRDVCYLPDTSQRDRFVA